MCNANGKKSYSITAVIFSLVITVAGSSRWFHKVSFWVLLLLPLVRVLYEFRVSRQWAWSPSLSYLLASMRSNQFLLRSSAAAADIFWRTPAKIVHLSKWTWISCEALVCGAHCLIRVRSSPLLPLIMFFLCNLQANDDHVIIVFYQHVRPF